MLQKLVFWTVGAAVIISIVVLSIYFNSGIVTQNTIQ